MESRAKLFGHPIHQQLIAFPIGLLATAVVFDIYFLVTRRGGAEQAAYWMIAVGVVAGLAAAIFGLIDWLAIPANTRAKRVGLLHGVGNVVVVALFAVSWYMRHPNKTGTTAAIVLAILGGALSLVTGWLGGELVDRLGVGVDDGAHLDAPSSLSGQSARGTATGGAATTSRV